MLSNTNKIASFMFLNFVALQHVFGQVPLGLAKYDPKIFFPEFFSYGTKLTPTRSSTSNSDEAEQLKFRRHARIESSKRNGKHQNDDEEEEEEKETQRHSPDVFTKMLRNDYDIFGNANPKPQSRSRGSVTFLSKNKDIGEELRALSLKTKLGLDVEESPIVEKRIRTVKRRIKKPKIQDILDFESNEVLIPFIGKPAYKRVTENQDLRAENHQTKSKSKNISSKKIKKHISEDDPRPLKSPEVLIPEQYKRVLKTAEDLNIQTGLETKNMKDANQFLIVSPKGSPDEGSLAHLRIKPQTENGQQRTSFNFNIMRGPYEDIYHRQMLNDLNAVSAILGRSARFTVLPGMNTVFSNIALKSKWDIERLK